MDEKVVLLNEDDLDGIVGGAFNIQVAQDLGLQVEERNGISFVRGTLQSGRTPITKEPSFTASGTITEKSLRSALKEKHVSFTFTNASGKSVELNKKQIAQLLS